MNYVKFIPKKRRKIMIVTTTPSVEGKKITQYLGLASGSAIIGTSFVRDFFARITDTVGGRSGAYETELKKARSLAISDMRQEAVKLGANAVVGVDFDYEAIGEKGGLLMVCATGTAVTVS